MTRLQLVAVEAGILLVFLIALYALVGWPFGGSGGDAGVVSADPSRTASPTPTGASSPGATTAPASSPADGCAPAVTRSFLSANQIVSFYGNPYAEQLGILGQHPLQDLPGLLQEQAASIDSLNGLRGVQPAFHIVYATAQADPGEDGLYLNYVDPDTLQQYIDLACRDHFLVFLDLQNGRGDPVSELKKIEPYLRDSHVHVAMDPEFTMSEGQVPGQVIGHLDAAQINAVQQELESFVEANGLSDKVLIVHQFDEGMITNKADIQRFSRVHLVIDMDGFGKPEVKVKKFATFAQPAEHAGIKVFFHQDDPPLTDQQIVDLDPDVIIFQ
jgi:hypothetical protein